MPKCIHCSEEMKKGYLFLGPPKTKGLRMGNITTSLYICPRVRNAHVVNSTQMNIYCDPQPLIREAPPPQDKIGSKRVVTLKCKS